MLSCSVVSDSLWPHGLQPSGPSVLGDSPGKNPEVGGHALLKGLFLTQGLNLCLLHCRRVLSPEPPRKPLSCPSHGKGIECSDSESGLRDLTNCKFNEFSSGSVAHSLCPGTSYWIPDPTFKKMDTIAAPCLCKHVVQPLSRVRLFVTSWAGAHKAPLSPAISWSLLKLTSTEAVMPSNQLLSTTLFPLCLQVCAPLRLSHMHLISFLACWSPFWPTSAQVPGRRGCSGSGCYFLTSTESRVRTSVSVWRTQGRTGLQRGGNREPGVSWAQIWWGLVAPPLPCH